MPEVLVIGISEVGKRDYCSEKLVQEIMALNFPRLGKDTHFEIQGTDWISNWINLKKYRSRYIIIKPEKAKDKDKIFKDTRRKKIVYTL